MTTFTATPDTATGAVALEIAQTSAVTAITRANANGIASVRVADGQLPSAASGTTIVTDYEAAQGTNTYVAYVNEYVTLTNRATNPSFETGTTGMVSVSSTLTLGTTTFAPPVYSGTKALTMTVGPGANAFTYCYQAITASAAQWVAFAVNVRWSTGSRYIRQKIDFRDGGGTVIGSAVAGPVWSASSASGGGSRQMMSALAPTGTVTARLYLYLYDDAAATVGPLDTSVMFSDAWHAATAATQADAEAQTAVYFDGSLADAAPYDYAWTGTAHASTSTRTENVTQVAATAELVVDKPWLLVPIAPQYSEQVETITDYSAGRETFSTVHQIIGRPDPLVVMGKLGTRKGNLEIFTASLVDAARVTRVFDRGEAVLLKQAVAGLDMYLAPLSLDLAPYQVQGQDTRWKLTVGYQEVACPGGNLAGALGWTFDALALAFPSFDAVKAAYANFDDLTLGDSI